MGPRRDGHARSGADRARKTRIQTFGYTCAGDIDRSARLVVMGEDVSASMGTGMHAHGQESRLAIGAGDRRDMVRARRPWRARRWRSGWGRKPMLRGRVTTVARCRSRSERRGHCGGGGPWSAALHAVDGNGPAGAQFAATPDVPGVAARTADRGRGAVSRGAVAGRRRCNAHVALTRQWIALADARRGSTTPQRPRRADLTRGRLR